MNNIRKTMAGISALALMMSSVFSCSLSKKDESSDEPVTEAQTTEAPTEPEEEEFRKADVNDAMAITWLSDYDINPAKGEKRSSALEIFEDVFGGKINYVYTTEEGKYDRLAEMINAGEEVDMFPYDKALSLRVCSVTFMRPLTITMRNSAWIRVYGMICRKSLICTNFEVDTMLSPTASHVRLYSPTAVRL